MHQFSVQIRHDMGGRRTHLVQVNGTTSPYVPAKTDCLPENARPAEGGEVEDLEVFLVHGHKQRRLPEGTEGKLRDDRQFIYAIHQALDEAEQAAIYDRGEAEYDACQERRLLMEGA